jgi:hypothetical protein
VAGAYKTAGIGRRGGEENFANLAYESLDGKSDPVQGLYSEQNTAGASLALNHHRVH